MLPTMRGKDAQNRQDAKGFSMIQLKIRQFAATDSKRYQLCGVVPGYVWKVGRVTVTKRAFHFATLRKNS